MSLNPYLLNLWTYFLVFSFVGWLIESIYKSIGNKKLINTGFLYGPFCPIYGVGAIIMYIFLDDVQGKPVTAFCLGFVILSVWEYLVGVFLEKVFHTKYWDYSRFKFNLHGRVCLLNSVFWGLLAILFVEKLLPFTQHTMNSIDPTIVTYIDLAISIGMIIDAIISIVNTLNLSEKLAKVEELNNSIKEKLESIKQKGEELEPKNISIQKGIDELKERRDMLAQSTYKRVARLKRAFPTLKSERIANFLEKNKENATKKHKK